MKQNKLFLGLATIAAALTFASCSSDEPEKNPKQQEQEENTISFTSTISKTRATEDPQGGNKLSTSSSLAIWAINETAEPDEAIDNGDNEQYTVDGNGTLTPNTAANTMKWPDGATLSFYAYAPYNSTYTYGGDNAFSVQTNQTGTDSYLASDLVLAQTTSQTNSGLPVELAFNHLMTKMIINITKEEGATVDLKYAKVSIVNTNTATTFNPSAASASILGTSSTPAEITLFQGDNTAEPSTVVGIVVPQTIAADTRLIKIQTNTNDASTNRTLYAKLSSATEFKSGQVYTLGVTIGDTNEPESEVEIELGSASLVVWSDNEGGNTLGVTTDEEIVYEVGDYLLNDGSLLKVNAADFADKKTNIVAVIFSTTSSDDGYDGYAVSIDGKLSTNTLAWRTSNGSVGTAKANLSDAIADYSGLSTKTTINSDYTTYPAFQCSGAPTITGTSYFSEWFIPSVGQFVDIIQNLGEQTDIRTTITTEGASQSSNNNIAISAALSTFLPKINAYAVTAKGEGNVIITASGDGSSDSNCFQYVTSTEKDETNMWMIKFPAADATNQRIFLSRGAGKTGTSNRNVLPVIAYKEKNN